MKGCQNCMHYRLVNGKIKKVEDDIVTYDLIDGKLQRGELP